MTALAVTKRLLNQKATRFFSEPIYPWFTKSFCIQIIVVAKWKKLKKGQNKKFFVNVKNEFIDNYRNDYAFVSWSQPWLVVL